jgi:hypothetical protein
LFFFVIVIKTDVKRDILDREREKKSPTPRHGWFFFREENPLEMLLAPEQCKLRLCVLKKFCAPQV